ncbi:MAG TPA: restriction endonuclease [Acidobacteriaceae bacterium]|nr:restriction endonuclease [Acidobacteriaceae bacterium]
MPFPYRKIAARLKEGDAATTTKAKGDALEDVVSWVFCAMPGIKVLKRNFVDTAGSSEIDLLLYNDPGQTPVRFLTEFPMVECKNWQAPVDSVTVRAFIDKLRSARLKVGILVAANGVTGDAGERTAAKNVIDRAFDRDGIALIVITRAELESFRSKEDVLAFLQDRFGDAIMQSTVLR